MYPWDAINNIMGERDNLRGDSPGECSRGSHKRNLRKELGSGQQMGSDGTGGCKPNDGPTDSPKNWPNQDLRFDTNVRGGSAAGDK